MIIKELNGIKVGDKVEYGNCKGYVAVIKPEGDIYYLLRLEGFSGHDAFFYRDKNWFPESEKKVEKNCFWLRKGDFKVITPKDKFKSVPTLSNIPTEIKLDYKQPEPELCIGRENKIMSNIKEFFNDLTVSAEDKELRKAGLKNDELSWTEEAISIVKDLEAKERGYKNWDKLSIDIGFYILSTLEAEELFKKFYDKLLSTAKKYNKKNNK